MLFKRAYTWLVSFYLLGFSWARPALFAQPISDLISAINLTAGQPDTLLISDLFFAESYNNLQFHHTDHIEISHQSSSNLLTLKPGTDAEGWLLLPFQFGEHHYTLLLNIEHRQWHEFQLKPEKTPNIITVFGSFNNWDREQAILIDSDGDGVFSFKTRLSPGQYEYKFAVDGEEMLDPNSTERVKTSLGGYNSAMHITSRHSDNAALHFLPEQGNILPSRLRFQYERKNTEKILAVSDIIALQNNQRISPEAISISENRIEIDLTGLNLDGEQVFRVTTNQDGLCTRLKTVRLINGKFGGPFAWEDAIIYSIMVDRFADGDPENNVPVKGPNLADKTNFLGGDLQGILNKIHSGYFDSLGVNTLWISPVVENTHRAEQGGLPPYRSYSSYHGYWPVHHQNVDSHFGDMALFQKLVSAAKKKGFKVLLDFVANHVHVDHPFYKEHRDWFGELMLADGRENVRLWEEHRLTTWFEPFLPSFDYANSDEALQFMTDNALWWLQTTNVDGFRHDAVKHIPNRFWRTLTRKLKQRVKDRKIYQIGETLEHYDLISAYVNNGQLDSQFNFDLFYTARYVFSDPAAGFGLLNNELQKTFAVYGDNNLMGNFMDSHDQIRFMAYADGDLELESDIAGEMGWINPPKVDNPASYRKVELHLAYLLSIPGVPVIYYGDEIGMTGADDPDNRRKMRFGKELNTYEKEMLDNVRQLIHLRKTHSPLRRGDFQPLLVTKDIYAYLRSDIQERILIVLNKSDKPVQIKIPLPKPYPLKNTVDCLTAEKLPIENTALNLTIPAYGWKILKVQ